MHPMIEHQQASHHDGEHQHDRHAGQGAHGEVFRRLFWWTLLLAVPVIVSSTMVQDWFGYHLTFWGRASSPPSARDRVGPLRRATVPDVVADELRPESKAAVDALHDRGKRVILVTGDARQMADAAATDLGIDEVFAEVLPADKNTTVAALQQTRTGRRHDRRWRQRRPAGTCRRRHRHRRGTDVAIESAGVILASDDPTRRHRGDRSVSGELSQDDPEPGVGHRLQPRCNPRRRGSVPLRWRDDPTRPPRWRCHSQRSSSPPTPNSSDASTPPFCAAVTHRDRLSFPTSRV